MITKSINSESQNNNNNCIKDEESKDSVVDDEKIRKRELNKVRAKRTRDRKKRYLEELETQNKALKIENMKLKRIIETNNLQSMVESDFGSDNLIPDLKRKFSNFQRENSSMSIQNHSEEEFLKVLDNERK